MNSVSQHFIDFARAGDFGYCRHYCAKCYFSFVRNFIEPMEKAHGTLPEGGFPKDMWWDRVMELPRVKTHLAEELENLPLREFLQLQHWDGQLCIAFAMLKDSGLQTAILRQWIKSCPEDARFVDVVVFYLLPRAFGGEAIYDEWISKAVKIAVDKRDASLVESLAWRLKAGVDKYPELLALATEMKNHSPAVAKAMNSRSL
jgi:hypothetical protein